MQTFQVFRKPRPETAFTAAAFLTVLLCPVAIGQEPPQQSKGIPPRATPAEYQTHVQVGSVTLAAEYDGHAIPDPQSSLTTEDYVVVEVAFFGPAGSHIPLAYQDFSLRINGQKKPVPAEGYVRIFKSLKDPEYIAPELANAEKSKGGGITTGGGGGGGAQDPNGGLPPVVHIPIQVSRGWEQRVQKAALPEGDRPLPQDGLIFFEHRSKTLKSAELIYSGPAGKVTIRLQ